MLSFVDYFSGIREESCGYTYQKMATQDQLVGHFMLSKGFPRRILPWAHIIIVKYGSFRLFSDLRQE